MEPSPKPSWNQSRRISTRVGVGLLSGLIISILVFAKTIECGEDRLVVSIPLTVGAGILGGLMVVALGLLAWRALAWLFCWKNSKRLVISVAAFVLVLFFARVEENWRGKRAWDNFRREWEAKGEHLDFKAFIPPPVPAEQNFALTPIVASCYQFLLDENGHRIRPARTNVVDRLNFNVAGTNRLSADIPTLGNWQTAKLTDLKVWQEYYRNSLCTNDANVVTHEFPFAAKPQSPGRDILLALSQSDEALQELSTASRLPASRFPLSYDLENPGGILLPHLSGMGKSAYILHLRALAELEAGESAKARADTLLIFRLTDKIRDEPFLISHLVRVAIMQRAVQVIYEGLATHRWTEPELLALASDVAPRNLAADFKFAMRGETVYQAAMCDYLRNNPRDLMTLFTGVGCLHDTDYEFPEIDFWYRLIYFIPPGWVYQNKINCARLMIERVVPIADETNRVFSVSKGREYDANFHNFSSFDIFHYLQRMLTPGMVSAAKRFALCQNSLNFSSTAMALERYHLSKGFYPETLEVLVPQFIPQLPIDATSGQSLKYRREANGEFVLYSVGWNEKDDSGVVAFKQSSPTSLDLDSGDWVWRYPQK